MKIIHCTLLVLGLAALVGCGQPIAATPTPKILDPDDALFDDLPMAKEQMKAILKDADSARYQDVYAYKAALPDATVYTFCGEVNAKNGFGAYDGYQRFMATKHQAETESQDPEFQKSWDMLCANRIRSVPF